MTAMSCKDTVNIRVSTRCEQRLLLLTSLGVLECEKSRGIGGDRKISSLVWVKMSGGDETQVQRTTVMVCSNKFFL